MAKLQTQSELETVVRKYRKRLGVDPTIYISISIVDDYKIPKHIKKSGGADAWIDQDKTHPMSYIYVSREYLKKNKKYPKHITRTIVHELLHIIVGDSFRRLKPSYDYSFDRQALVEETLVTRLAKAIVPVQNEALYD